MSINPAARRDAQLWYEKPDGQDGTTAQTCPKHFSAEEKAAVLREGKPEFYGKSARFITDELMSRSLGLRDTRSDIGLVRADGTMLGSDTITTFSELEHGFLTTLRYDLNAAILDIRTMKSDAEFDYDAFESYVSLDALFKYRASLSGLPAYSDSFIMLSSGIKTATTHSIGLLEQMVQIDPTPAVSAIRLSHKPLMRIASISANQLEDFDTRYLVAKNSPTIFVTTKRGTIDFTTAVREQLVAAPDTLEPTIGCPVLFGKDAVKDYWQWVVSAADTCGLLMREPCQ